MFLDRNAIQYRPTAPWLLQGIYSQGQAENKDQIGKYNDSLSKLVESMGYLVVYITGNLQIELGKCGQRMLENTTFTTWHIFVIF